MTRVQHTDHLVVTKYSVRSVLGQCKVRDTDLTESVTLGNIADLIYTSAYVAVGKVNVTL